MADKKAFQAESLVGLAELKTEMAKARHGTPVSCAVALGKDKAAILLLDHKRKPRQLGAELRKQATANDLELTPGTM